jgi:hypothetical protein
MSTQTTQVPTVDPDVTPWLDDKFAPIDTRTGGEEFVTNLVNDFGTNEQKTAIEQARAALEAASQPPIPPVETAPITPATETQVAEPTAVEPEVYEYDDGSVVVVETLPTGKKATLSLGEGSGKEVFYGKDEGELLRQVLTAKLNASKKIRQQNKQLKLQIAKPATTQAAPAARKKHQELTADETFEIKNKFADDPNAALNALIEKRTGMTLEQIVENACLGAKASVDLHMDTEARAFVESHPDYLSTNNNYRMMIGYLAKAKLGIELTDENINQVMLLLPQKGFFNRYTLAEAYNELAQDGLLELQVVEEEVEPVEPEAPPAPAAPVKVQAQPPAQPVAPAPASPPVGIPGQVVRPRAASIGLGVQPSQASGTPTPETSAAPSVEELENMSDKEINDLMASVIRFKAQSARR